MGQDHKEVRYLVFEKYEVNNYGFLTLTNKPLRYAKKFEPIDVANGAMVFYSENGGWYEIKSQSEFDTQPISKNVSVVDTGSWNDGLELSRIAGFSLDLHAIAKKVYSSRKHRLLHKLRNQKIPRTSSNATTDELFRIFGLRSSHMY